MIIKVRWHRQALRQLLDFVSTFLERRDDQLRYLDSLRKAADAKIIADGGVPSNAVAHAGLAPATYTWEFIQNRLWLELVVRQKGNPLIRALGLGVKDVLIHGAFDQIQPPPG
jgi:hypothetical protein